MEIPEGAQTVEVEGRDLKIAVAGAAEQLGLHPKQVDYKLDLSHFRSITGTSVARTTVKIVAWESGRDAPSPEEEPPAEAEPKKKKKRSTQEAKPADEDAVEASDEDEESEDKPKRKRRSRRKKSDEEEAAEAEASAEDAEERTEPLRGAESDSTEASDFAQSWFEQLLEHMDVEGKVTGSGSDDRVHLRVDAERAGRIVGKRGATLGAIRHLLGLALKLRFGELTVDVDVGDDRQERKPRRDRERDRDRDRDRRGRDRRPRSGRSRRSAGRSSGHAVSPWKGRARTLRTSCVRWRVGVPSGRSKPAAPR